MGENKTGGKTSTRLSMDRKHKATSDHVYLASTGLQTQGE